MSQRAIYRGLGPEGEHLAIDGETLSAFRVLASSASGCTLVTKFCTTTVEIPGLGRYRYALTASGASRAGWDDVADLIVKAGPR